MEDNNQRLFFRKPLHRTLSLSVHRAVKTEKGEFSEKIKRKLSMVFTSFLFICIPVFFLFSLSYAGEASFEHEDIVLPDNVIFLDRNGKILRFIPDEKGERHLWISKEEIPDIVKKAFIAAEDKRFYDHHGYDLIAILRALKDNIIHGGVVSGASTISQQLVRLIYPHERSLKAKIAEIFRSVRLENTLSKEEILEQYLNRVPMGNNIIGVELASRVYFNKTMSDLSAGEAALLSSLPKAPGTLNPYGRDIQPLLERKNYILSQMAELGFVTEEELKILLNEEIVISKKPIFPYRAPHFIDLLIARGYGVPGKNYTTIDLDLQTEVEKIVSAHSARLAAKSARQAAALVVHNPTMEIVASVGSISYSEKDEGYNNGTIAFRSAGSTIKPFLYAQAIEEGHTVSSLLEDILRKYQTPIGHYSPDNVDRKEYGPVTMRQALGSSLNISAIKMLEIIEIEHFYQILQRLNLMRNTNNAIEDYGLGLVIGNAEVSLERLVRAYATFANKGDYGPLKYAMNEDVHANKNVFSPETAYIITDILSDPLARMLTFGGVYDMYFPFKVSLKTGTSTRYRDCWIIGYTPEYTVGVWVGNFEGFQTARLTGASGSAPIFKDIMYTLHAHAHPSTYTQPEHIVNMETCGISGMRPGPHCDYVTKELFIKGTEPVKTCTFHDREKYFHALPSTYAGWVYNKDKKISAGSYRLSGFSKNLDEVFLAHAQDNEALQYSPGIRVRNTPSYKTPEKSHTAGPTQKHYFIGDSISDYSVKDHFYDTRIRIVYPLPGDIFIMDRNYPQVIKMEVASSNPVEYIDWYIDGKHYMRSAPPYHAYWNLKKGKHTVIAATEDKRGDSIDIWVE